jgi:hypothetical protein
MPWEFWVSDMQVWLLVWEDFPALMNKGGRVTRRLHVSW